ncbi:MAG: hypothetical protein JXA90_03570 [Planctomycetes bacterium]|nr:hypothetical protein [Planctomycetota bacterium]
MKSPACLTLVLGFWVGASAMIWFTAIASFSGIEEALSINEPLGQRANVPPGDKEALRKSSIFVFAGELNRLLFRHFNRAQLVVAAAALLVGVFAAPRPSAIAPIILAALCVLALTFYLAPAITDLGRQLDFVSRASPPAAELAKFERLDLLHDVYKYVEAGKCLLLIAACFFALRKPRPASEA